MPHSELHQKQKQKNWTLFGVLLAVVVFFFVLGLVKLQITY